MPRQNKSFETSDSIKQISFFTDEGASETESENTNISENDTESLLLSGVNEASFISGIAKSKENENENTDTEVIESEILPEQTVVATTLTISEKFDGEETNAETNTATNKKPKKRHNTGNLKRESVLIHFLILVAETVSRTLKNSFLASILTAYDKTAELFRSSVLYHFFAKKPTELFGALKKRIRRNTTDSLIPKKLDALTSALMLIRSRIYGLILLAFAISSLFIHFFVNSYFSISIFSIYTPFIAIGVIIVSLFLIFSGKTLSQTLLASKIFSAFGFKLLGINKNSLNENDSIELSSSGAIVFGLLLGFLTIIFPIQSILIFALAVIYATIVIRSPETGLISLFLIAPFASLGILIGAIGVISLSYTLKVLSGKRTLTLEFPDLFVGIFVLMIVFGGVITFGDKGNVITYVLFTGIYFIAASILRSSIWFKRSINTAVLVGAVISVYAVIARLLGESLDFKLDLTPETDIGDATAGILSSFSVLSYFVLILGLFLLASFFTSKNKATRFGLLISNICAFIYLFLTLPSGAWLAAVAAYIILLVLWKSRSAVYMIIATLFLPFLPVLKIHSVENFFHSLISINSRYDLWNAVLRMFADFGICGIGLSENAFSSVYSAYFIGNTENAAHSGSLIMQIMISLGIFGLVVFCAIIFFVLQSSFSYGRSCSDKSDFNRLMCYAGMCGIIASFIWGINEFIWYNPRIMLLFWLVMGVTVSARRSATELAADNRETNIYGDTYLE